MGRQAIVSHKNGLKTQQNGTVVTKQPNTQFGIVRQNENARIVQPTNYVEPSALPSVSLTTNVQQRRATCYKRQ